MPWYYEVNREQRGPVSDEELAKLVQSGVVRAETLVWREGWPDWRPYGQAGLAVPPPAPSHAATPMVGAAGFDAETADTAVCAVSGQRWPKRDMLEFEGRWVSAEHKEEFFQRLREGVAQPRDMVYATFWRRFGAKLIDGILLWVIGIIPQGVVSMLLLGSFSFFTPDTSGVDPEQLGTRLILLQVIAQLLGMAIGLAYGLYFIRKQDATPGKRILGLKLLRADGSRLSKGRIVGRYFSEIVSAMIFAIGYLMAAFDKEERRALHDRMCDTRVIDVRNT
jgi:uncharacterized RDD family membrane protein YckC